MSNSIRFNTPEMLLCIYNNQCFSLGMTMWKLIEGVAVGCGWQAFVAYVNIGCYYIVGVPIGCLLGFKFNLGIKVQKIKLFYKIVIYCPFEPHYL